MPRLRKVKVSQLVQGAIAVENMGNAYCRRGEPFIPGLALDQVVAGTSPDSKCILYSLANFRKGGILIESFNKGGSKGVIVMLNLLKVECNA